jgi:acyl-CoA thioester hydrolase
MSREDFHIEERVHLEHIDLYGVMYHPLYLSFFERARTEWLRQHGLSCKTLRAHNTSFVVSEAQIRYKTPLYLDDVFTITATPYKDRAASIVFKQQLFKDNFNTLCCEYDVQVITTNNALKPIRIPTIILEHLSHDH